MGLLFSFARLRMLPLGSLQKSAVNDVIMKRIPLTKKMSRISSTENCNIEHKIHSAHIVSITPVNVVNTNWMQR